MQDYILGIKVESHPNTNSRTYHVRHRMVPERISGYICGTDYPDSKEKQDFPVLTWAIVNALRDIPGIRRVSAWPYEITIEKGNAFTWKEIEPFVTPIFVSYHPILYQP